MAPFRTDLIKLGTTNPELRPHIRPILASMGGAEIDIDFKNDMTIREWVSPGELGAVWHLNVPKSGNDVARSIIQIARDNLSNLTRMESGADVVAFIKKEIYRKHGLGGIPRWDYTPPDR